MEQILVIVESPGKIKKIKSILGKKYVVMASVGHIIDLDSKKMSIDIENNFKPNYKPISRAKKVIKDLREAYKKCDDIVLATDKDREGEMIAWSISYILNLNNPKRITFNSISKDELLNAIKNPERINMDLVNAQQARRCLDRIVGYELSPLLWSNIQKKLSAGRVQSVVTKLIIDKENEIEKRIDEIKNDKSSIFKFKGSFQFKDIELEGKLKKTNGNIEKFSSIDQCRDFLNKCIKSKFKIIDINEKVSKRSPPPPFTTSMLQQESSRKLGYSVKTTMMIAQKLYENGYITYMRTDSVNLSKTALDQIENFIINKFGKKFHKRKNYNSKKKNTQEAHEAIRPTKIALPSVKGKNSKFGNSEVKLYDLIWKRTIASQMESAEYDVQLVNISISKDKEHIFESQNEELKFEGYLKLYNIKLNIGNFTKLNVDDEVMPIEISGKQEFKKIPLRYNEASLVNKLDPKNLNIGRPATYASIIDIILKRKYVEKLDHEGIEKDSTTILWNNNNNGNKIVEKTDKIKIGSEKNKFTPTIVGKLVNTFLEDHFEELMKYEFTAKMEDELDRIANGEVKWNDVLKEFYDDFHLSVEKTKKLKPIVEDKYTRKLGIDPETKYDVIATLGAYGPMIKICGPTKSKSKCAPIKKPLTIETITLEEALEILIYPILLGKYGRKNVLLQKGQYGFYIKYGKSNISIDNEKINLEEAIEKIDEMIKRDRGLAQFKSKDKVYTVLDGIYGKYIRITNIKGIGKALNVSLPKEHKIKELDLDKVEEIVKKHFENKSKRKYYKSKFNKYKKKK